MKLAGQVAIVTGAGRGFGRAIAERLAAEGARVALFARTKDQLETVAAGIGAKGGKALVISGDATNRDDVARAVREAESTFGPTTLLISNAGTPGPFGPLWLSDPDEWWQSQALHIRAPLLFLHAVLPGMVARKSGRVIAISAFAMRWPTAYLSAYCTGKIAQVRIIEEAALETKDHGVALFAIDPGFVFTGIADETMNSPDAQRWLPGMVARLREKQGEPDDKRDLARCAQRCVDLASGRYDALTGKYFELPDDLDAMLAGAPPHWQQPGAPKNPGANL